MKPLCFQRFGKSNVEKTMVLQPTVNETIGLLKVSDHKSCMRDFGSMQSSKNKFLQHKKANLQTCPGAIYPPNPAKRNARLLQAGNCSVQFTCKQIHVQTNPLKSCELICYLWHSASDNKIYLAPAMVIETWW